RHVPPRFRWSWCWWRAWRTGYVRGMVERQERGADVVVVMGVSGCGKTTIARRVASRLGAEFVEGDELHPEANVAKMRSGQPLTDEDRWPWLRDVACRIGQLTEKDNGGVVTCSALKRAYRDVLRDGRP